MTPAKKNIEIYIRYKALGKLNKVYSVGASDIPYDATYRPAARRIKSDTSLWFLHQRLKYT